MPARPPLAAISGGSSGIGLAIALLLARKGFQLALIARDEAKLAAAREALLAAGAVDVTVHALDVADAPACETALAAIDARQGALDWLVTCAGIAEPGLFLEIAAESHHRQMEINYFGTLNLVRPAAIAMAARGSGRIVLVSSAAAFVGVAGYSAYAPGKFAVRALAETLRVELAAKGVSVSVAFPPDTDTPQYAAEQAAKPEATKRISAGGGLLSAEQVARGIVSGAEKRRFSLTPSPLIELFGLFHSLYAPFFRRRQIRILAEVEREAKGR